MGPGIGDRFAHLRYHGSPAGGCPPKTRPSVPGEPAALPVRRPDANHRRNQAMKDHEIIPIRRDDAPVETPTEIIRPRESSTLVARARPPIDRTARLVADVLGTSLDRAVDVLQALGG